MFLISSGLSDLSTVKSSLSSELSHSSLVESETVIASKSLRKAFSFISGILMSYRSGCSEIAVMAMSFGMYNVLSSVKDRFLQCTRKIFPELLKEYASLRPVRSCRRQLPEASREGRCNCQSALGVLLLCFYKGPGVRQSIQFF